MDTERLRVTLEVWWVRWLGRFRTLARLVAILAVGAGGFDVVVRGGELFGPFGGLVLIAFGLIAVLLLSVFPRR